MSEKRKTFKDLKDFLLTLTDEELSQEITIEVVEYANKKDVCFGVLEEDILWNKDDAEDYGTLEVLRGANGENFDENDYEISVPKGTVYLTCDD